MHKYDDVRFVPKSEKSDKETQFIRGYLFVGKKKKDPILHMSGKCM